MTGIPARPALFLVALSVLTSACGLSAELDREADPARTASRARPAASPPAADVPPTPPFEIPDSLCPTTGLRASTSMVTAAMGLRAMTVTLTNCSRADRRLEGYPDVRVRGADRKPMPVTVLKGPGPITTLEDPGPHPVPLKPGESAYSVFVWRYSAVDAATLDGSGVYVEIAPAAGVPRQTVEPDGGLDIGDTGLLGTTAWQKTAD
ncbi:DUF4232 domain-containing protein [Streptomyces sp. NPDC048629]|uniref:DUF4232 domain-containing protein n=1 Tax=Streptomyces sp. NPDC048629 TaxID=3154824 RepID=UPI00341CDDB9